MRIAIVTVDGRDRFCYCKEPEPILGTAPLALLEGLAAFSQCEVHVVSCVQQPVRSPEKPAESIYYHSVIVPKWGWMRGAYIGCVRAVRKKLREIKPDLVHGQGTERYCALAAVYSGLPNVLTIHGNMRELARINQARPFSFHWLAACLERFTLPRSRGVFCNSHYTQGLVKGLAAATWLVPNPVRGMFFSPATAIPPSLPPILLNIGVISPRKSQIEILELAARLHQRQVKFQFHFLGPLDEGTPYGARFRQQINQAEREGFARYIGMKNANDLVACMDAAAGMVHAPYEEAFGLVAAEGLARNLKFFGARVGGLVDIATGTEGAELFEPGDMAALEEGVFKWLSSGYVKPTQAARQIRERYHPEVVARRHLEIYREILGHEK
jgi:glycosyltransferase involved in cell wall biosynthesis